MPIKSRPAVESLEGRMLLSGAHGAGEYNIAFVPPAGGAPLIVSQQASSATLTLERTPLGHNSLRDPLKVRINTRSQATSFPSAVAGVQYVPVLETITFPPGVSSESVTIPVIAGAANPGHVGFEVFANFVGSPSYAASATEEVYLTANNMTPVPRIVGAHMVVQGGRTSEFLLQFNMPMDPATVQNTAAYDINNPELNFEGGFPPAPPITSAAYDPATNTVDLHLAKSVDARNLYEIGQGFPSSSTGVNSNVDLKSASGTLLNDDGVSTPDDFQILISDKKTTIDPVMGSL